MTTIRLSDRLELRPCASGHDLYADDEYLLCLGDAGLELAALANPPRYDLPPGVIHGSDGKFYAPGDVVRTLDRVMWTIWDAEDDECRYTKLDEIREVRPTAANPLQPLPDHTFRLPDGELACYRRDAAKLREAGATLRYTDTRTRCTFARQDVERSSQVLMVEFPAPPKTERVPWWEAVGRKHQDLGPILSVFADGDGAQIETATHHLPADADGTVEVLLTAAGVSSDR